VPWRRNRVECSFSKQALSSQNINPAMIVIMLATFTTLLSRRRKIRG
jgi:hypothetical protein